jgi:hypothetical protein
LNMSKPFAFLLYARGRSDVASAHETGCRRASISGVFVERVTRA